MAADTALAALKVAAADCFAAQAGFGPDEAAAGLLAADELRALFFPLARGRVTAPSAGVPPPAMVAVAAEPSPLTLLQLPPDVIVLVFSLLDARSLARVAATCSGLYRDQPRPIAPVFEALRQRAAERGHVSPGRLPDGPPRGLRTSPGWSAGVTRRGRQWRLAPSAPSLLPRAGGS